jgi:pullulanase/glycogen debranching enzyme
MALLLLSPGVPMLAAGQDYMHSKKGVRNTYQRGDLNALNYNEIIPSKDFHEWIKSLISFRNSEDGLHIRLPFYLPESHYFCTIGPSNSFAHIVFSKADDTDSPFLLLLVNPSNQEITLPTPAFCEGRNSKLLLGKIHTKLGQISPISLQVWKFF